MSKTEATLLHSMFPQMLALSNDCLKHCSVLFPKLTLHVHVALRNLSEGNLSNWQKYSGSKMGLTTVLGFARKGESKESEGCCVGCLLLPCSGNCHLLLHDELWRKRGSFCLICPSDVNPTSVREHRCFIPPICNALSLQDVRCQCTALSEDVCAAIHNYHHFVVNLTGEISFQLVAWHAITINWVRMTVIVPIAPRIGITYTSFLALSFSNLCFYVKTQHSET